MSRHHRCDYPHYLEASKLGTLGSLVNDETETHMKNCLMALTLLLGTLSLDARAATVSRMTLSELSEASELVFIATVKSQTVSHEKAPLRIFTHTIFEIETSLKGNYKGDYTLVQLGGEIGEGVPEDGSGGTRLRPL